MTVVDGPCARSQCSDTSVFFGQWLRSPGRVGAIAPSSPALARAITASLPERGEPVVVELGAGTGPFTTEIQGRLGNRGRHLAVEVNPTMAALLRNRFRAADVVEGDARHLPQLLAERGIGDADVIVSGLPWAVFRADVQDQLLGAIVEAMSPDGVFATFSYLHALPLRAARRFRALVADRFEEVLFSRTVWRNVPPAYVMYARRPRFQ
ncbi:class I SAM-dependent methyltransferase [Mycolicibacterium sp.]|uniref:class I SAM-dependent methyltransferase n=1 Tax=Mycolicibacterium sp. TaxID=2320850 RepID=UPI003D0DC910